MRKNVLRTTTCTLAAALYLCATMARAETGLPPTPPYYGSTKKEETHVRAGPGTQYPILFTLKRQGWPLKIIAEYDNYKKVQDLDGEEGWVHHHMLSEKRTAIVAKGTIAPFYKDPADTAATLKFAPNVVLELKGCTETFCQVKYKKKEGWTPRHTLTPTDKAPPPEKD